MKSNQITMYLDATHPLAPLAQLLDDAALTEDCEAVLRPGRLLGDLGDDRLFRLATEVVALLKPTDARAVADVIGALLDTTIDQIVEEALRRVAEGQGRSTLM